MHKSRSLSRIIAALALLAQFISVQPLFADFLLRRVDLEKGVRIRFPLERAIFLVDQGGGKLSFHPGVHLQLPLPEGRFDNSSLWLVTTRLDLPYQVERINFGVLLVGRAGELSFVPPEKNPVSIESFSEAGITQLRADLLLEQERLLGLKNSFEKQDQQFKALQTELMADRNIQLQPLLDQDSLQAARIKSLESDIDSLKLALESLKGKENSAAIAQRERQLAQQVSELADAARMAEAKESERKEINQADLRQAEMLREQSTGYSVEQLQQQLEDLRQRRIARRKELEN